MTLWSRTFGAAFRLHTRSFRTSAPKRGGGSDWRKDLEDFNEPGGRLFGEPPLPPGVKRQWEDWEYVWYPTLASCVVILVVGLNYRPDTYIKTWAKNEAIAREEARKKKALEGSSD